MIIQVIPTAQQAQDIDFGGKTAVVIDVLRATSVITTALDNGAREVLPVADIAEAQSLYAQLDDNATLRGGECNALKIEGFDLGNSPLEYKRKTVEGKTIILTTTNGTQAIQNVKGADVAVLACFRNASAVAEYLLRRLPQCDIERLPQCDIERLPQCDIERLPQCDIERLPQCDSPTNGVVIVCAGTEGRFSLDDGLCAGMLIELLKQKTEVETDDLGLLLNHYYNESQANLLGALSGCYHLKRLFTLGFYDDIKFSLQTNCTSMVPVLQSICPTCIGGCPAESIS